MSALAANQKALLEFYGLVFPRLSDLLNRYSTAEMLQLCELLSNQTLPCESELDTIEIIHDLYSNSNKGEVYMIAVQAFQYGRIQGIRAERARRKVGVN